MKKLIIPGLLVFGVLGVLGIKLSQGVLAEETSNYPPLIQKMIEHFNLDTDEVNKVMAEQEVERETHRQEREAQRQVKLEDKLSQAVTDGLITQEQKAKILAKMTEMWTSQGNPPKKGDWGSLTNEERRSQMEERRTELEKKRADFEEWEKALGIDLKELLGEEECGIFGEGRGGKMGLRGEWH